MRIWNFWIIKIHSTKCPLIINVSVPSFWLKSDGHTMGWKVGSVLMMTDLFSSPEKKKLQARENYFQTFVAYGSSVASQMSIEHIVCICGLITDCLVNFTFLLKNSCEGELFLNCKCFLVNSCITDVYRKYCMHLWIDN